MSLKHALYQKQLIPAKLEARQYVQLFFCQTHPRTAQKVLDTIDREIQKLTPSASTQLTFTMVAALLGYQSKTPTRDGRHVWRTVWSAAGGDLPGYDHDQVTKTSRYILGCLVQWRIALDDRDWLCIKTDTGRINHEGEEMLITIYWIPPPVKASTFSDLRNRWGRTG